jgi:hypothetical protein
VAAFLAAATVHAAAHNTASTTIAIADDPQHHRQRTNQAPRKSYAANVTVILFLILN